MSYKIRLRGVKKRHKNERKGKNMTKNEVSAKIKQDWGTVSHFCKKHGLNFKTFRHVLYGYGSSKPIIELLKKHNYIKSADELKRVG